MTKLAPDHNEFSCWHYKNDATHVCFFSQATFQWLALQWDADMTFADTDVVLFHKKTASSRQSLDSEALAKAKKRDCRALLAMTNGVFAVIARSVATWQSHDQRLLQIAPTVREIAE